MIERLLTWWCRRYHQAAHRHHWIKNDRVMIRVMTYCKICHRHLTQISPAAHRYWAERMNREDPS